MSQTIKIDPENPDPRSVEKVLAVLKAGGVVAYPTETFYGLGIDTGSEKAVDRIFSVKGRNFKKPIPLIIGRRQDLASLVSEIPQPALSLMKRFWPGPLTIIFRAAPSINSRLTGGTGKIGIRLSSHPVALALAAALRGPVTATSANLSGMDECITAGEALTALGEKIDLIVDGGASPGGKGSTIVDITVDPVRIIREGVIPEALIRGTL